MLDQDQIARLLEISDQHRDELLGISPARTFGSDPDGEGSTPSSPANFNAVSSSEQESL